MAMIIMKYKVAMMRRGIANKHTDKWQAFRWWQGRNWNAHAGNAVGDWLERQTFHSTGGEGTVDSLDVRRRNDSTSGHTLKSSEKDKIYE